MIESPAVFLAEDEYLLAVNLCRKLEERGASIVGPAPSVQKAIEIVRSSVHIDYAILDINLQGEFTFGVADLLRERAIPFIFFTGYDESIIPDPYRSVHRCRKLAGVDEICRALEIPQP